MDEPAAVAHEQARRWLRWAAEDLVAARHSAADTEVAPRVACSLAQQAAEKAIKALVVSSDLDPPKTHNLLRLARMLIAETADRLLALDLEDLTRWAIEGRYPADLDEATSRDAGNRGGKAKEFRNRPTGGAIQARGGHDGSIKSWDVAMRSDKSGRCGHTSVVGSRRLKHSRGRLGT